MASPVNSGSFQSSTAPLQHAHRSLQGMPTSTPSYPRSAVAQSHVVPPYEGIVDFTYSNAFQPQQQTFGGYPTNSDLVPQQTARPDGTEWKQSSFFSYRPNEVKHRKRTTRQQLKVLEETFRTTQKPDGNVRKALALQLDMTPRNVQVWFQNRRAKDKTLAKRAQKSMEEANAVESHLDAAEPTDIAQQESLASPVESLGTYIQSETISPCTSAPSSSMTSPVDAIYLQQQSHAVRPFTLSPVEHGAISESSEPSASSEHGSYGPETVPSRPLEYPRHIYGPRGSLPHIQAVPYTQDFQHQRSNSSPAFLTNVDRSSNLSLTTYASISGILYPQQLASQHSHPMYQSYPSRVPAVSAGPLPASDFVFGMPAQAAPRSSFAGDADKDTETITYSHIGSLSGSDTPSSLSHYGSVASFGESDAHSYSAQAYDEDVVGAPIGWQPEQRRGSNAMTQGGMSSRGYSPLSASFAQSSPRPESVPSAENEIEFVDNAVYTQSWPAAYPEEVKGYPQESLGYDLAKQDGSHASNYQSSYLYGQDASVVVNYANVDPSYVPNGQVPFPVYRQAPVSYTFA